MTELDTAIKEFRSSFGGEVVEPDDATYDQERVLFNGMIGRQRRPCERDGES